MLRRFLGDLLSVLRERPAALAAVAQALTALVVTRYHFTPGETGAIEAAGSAVYAAVVALLSRPVKVQALTGLVSAVVTLAVAFGWQYSTPTSVSLISTVMTAVLLLVGEQRTVALAGHKAGEAH